MRRASPERRLSRSKTALNRCIHSSNITWNRHVYCDRVPSRFTDDRMPFAGRSGRMIDRAVVVNGIHHCLDMIGIHVGQDAVT